MKTGFAGRGWARIGLAAALSVYLGFNVATLMLYPPQHCDEAYYSDTAMSAVTRGQFGTPAQGPVYGIATNHTIISRLYSLGLAAALQTLGVSLRSGRLFSLLGTLAGMAATAWLGRRLYGWRTGLWAALLYGFSIKAFIGAHTTRPEMWLAAAIVALLAVLVTDSARLKSRHALIIGVAGPLTGDIHFNGMYFLVGITLAVLYLWFVRTRRWDLVIGYGSGVVIGVLLWAALRFLPDPAAAWYQWRVGFTRLGMGWGSLSILARLASMPTWILDQFWRGNRGMDAIEGTFFLFGILYALKRRSRSDAVLLLVIFGAALAFGALMTQKAHQYRVLWVPLLWLMGVEGSAAMWDRAQALVQARWPGWRWAISPAWVWGAMIVVYLVGSGWLASRFVSGEHRRAAAELRALIPPGTTVIGDSWWWFDFQADHTFYDDLYLVYYASEVGGPPGAAVTPQVVTEGQLRDALRLIGVEYVILDPLLHCMYSPDYQPNLVYHKYVESHCESVGEVHGGWYGQEWAATYPLGENNRVYYCAAGT